MTTTGTRTFDCPWCGAISPVPADHLGEHFSCAECRKATKLTEKNTSTRAPTEAPPDAPHLTGDRTFDCPWCGAISSVPSSHLGEAFHCPECDKRTKLTSTNTRRATVTAPPPDAPHESAAASGGGAGKALVAVAVLALGGGAAWWFTAGPGATPPIVQETVTIDNTAGRSAAGSAKPAPMPSVSPPSVEPATGPAPASGTPPAMETEAAPPPAVAPPADADAERAALAKQMAAAKLLTADAAVEAAKSALEAWSKANPGALDAREFLPALGETTAEIDRVLADKATIPDPAKATPDQVRAADAAVRRFVEASPARAKAAASILEAMRSDRGGRDVAGVADWKELHLTGDGARRASAALTASWQALAGAVPADLVKALTDAVAARAAAKADVDAASLPAPR